MDVCIYQRIFLKDIEFSIIENYAQVQHSPFPAKKYLPTWLKNMSGHYNNMPTMKKCPPLMDAMGMGYIIPMWQEFQLIPNDGMYSYRAGIMALNSPFENQRDLLSYQFPQQYQGSPLDEYQVFKISTPWIIKTPPGTSVMIIPPVLGSDAPFEVIPAVIDTDEYHISFGFTCKIKYTGTPITIAPGTPIAQIIPFTRESWKHDITETSLLEHSKKANKLKTYIYSGYKKLFWKKKEFN